MKQRFASGELEIEIDYEPEGLAGKPCVRQTTHPLGITIRVNMEDAETLGDALIACVRAAETKSTG